MSLVHLRRRGSEKQERDIEVLEDKGWVSRGERERGESGLHWQASLPGVTDRQEDTYSLQHPMENHPLSRKSVVLPPWPPPAFSLEVSHQLKQRSSRSSFVCVLTGKTAITIAVIVLHPGLTSHNRDEDATNPMTYLPILQTRTLHRSLDMHV